MTDNDDQARLDRIQKTIEETRGPPLKVDYDSYLPCPQNKPSLIVYFVFAAILVIASFIFRG